MRKITLFLLLTSFTIGVFSQETVFWRSEASNDNWANNDESNVNNWYRSNDRWDVRRPDLANNQWSPNATKSYNIVNFDNSNRPTTIVNGDIGGSKYHIHNILLKNGTNRIFNSNNNAFLSLGGGSGNPKIEAFPGSGTGTYTFNVPITYEKKSELNPVAGNLIFNSHITNGGFDTDVWGSNDKSLTLTSMSGTGGLTIKNATTVKIIANTSFTGNTNIEFGKLELSANLASSTLTVRSGAALLISDNATINNLVVESGGTLTIAAGKTLTISAGKKATINGTVNYNTTGKIKLLSTSIEGTATLTGSYDGPAEVQQHLSSVRNWYMSAPVSTNTTAGNSYYEYLENGSNTGFTPPATAYWKLINSGTPMTSGKGYILIPSTSGIVTFQGNINNGNQTTILSRTETNTTHKGFNLVGNPYPSYIDAATLLSVNRPNGSEKVENNIWYRTHTGSAYQFQTYNATADINVPQASNGAYIPPMQAFWVRALANDVNLNFTNAMRKHNETAGNILLRAPKSSSSYRQLIRLLVTNGTNSDEMVIYSDVNAQNGYNSYDSPKWLNGNNSPNPDIYTQVGSEKLVIDGRNSIPVDVIIPVIFAANATTNSQFTISASELVNIPSGITVMIFDNNVNTSISDGGTYTFSAAPGTTKTLGLVLRSQGSVTGFNKENLNSCFVFANNNQQIEIHTNKYANINVYNSTGQLMKVRSMKNTSMKIDVPAAGVYLVNVGEKTFKVVVP